MSDLHSKIDAIHDKVTRMEPKLVDISDDMKLMNLRQRSIENTMVKHDVEIATNTRDINAMGIDVRDLKTKQTIQSTIEENVKWISFIGFVNKVLEYKQTIAFTLSAFGLTGLIATILHYIKRKL